MRVMLGLFTPWVGGLIIGSCLALVTHHYWERVYDAGAEDPAVHRRFLLWLVKGAVVPALLWALFNTGWLPGPPLMPEVEIAKARGGNWAGAWADTMGASLWIVASYWAAATVAGLLGRVYWRAMDRGETARVALFLGALFLPVTCWILWVYRWPGLGFALMACFIPALHFTWPLQVRKRAAPSYSRAIAKLKFGKYKAAERDVIEELEACQEDFDGWILLADLYANHFHELPDADQTIRGLCEQPNITGLQISLALHRLADWHLQKAEDPLRARAALELICQKLPGSHFARMAQLRIDQLPATREELREQRRTKIIRLPPLSEEAPAPAPPLDRERARALAEQCVARLTRDPNDLLARERLAVTWAESLGEVGLAIEQLELLLELADPPAEKKVHWLALMASWELKLRNAPGTARGLLERIVREYPQSVQAFAAQRRLQLMDFESRPPRGSAASIAHARGSQSQSE